MTLGAELAISIAAIDGHASTATDRNGRPQTRAICIPITRLHAILSRRLGGARSALRSVGGIDGRYVIAPGVTESETQGRVRPGLYDLPPRVAVPPLGAKQSHHD